MKKVAGTLKLTYSQYRELQSFAQFGSDLDADTKTRPCPGERVVEVLKQDRSSPLDVALQVSILYALCTTCSWTSPSNAFPPLRTRCLTI